MIEEKLEELAASAEWHTESLRLSVFLNPTTVIDEPRWWEAIVGEPPEDRTVQPKVGVMQEQGQFLNGNLILIVRPDRIDWLFNSLNPGDVIERFENSINDFAPLMSRWLEMAPPIQRMAFGAALQLPAEDRIDGYRKLSSFLHYVRLDSENSTDFIYQINRARPSVSGVDNLRINRLSKWQAGVTKVTEYTVIPGGSTPRIGAVEQKFYAKLDLDINTAADFVGDLPENRLQVIFNELTQAAQEIAREGDTP
jgi:hypothetical protein